MIWRNEASRLRLEGWYRRFQDRIGAPVESLTVETSFGSSHVLRGGPKEAPPLVCLHAMRTSSAHLLSELHPLLGQFRLVAPDLPGQSVRGPQVRLPLSDGSLADWLMQVLDAMGIRETSLLGISWGGFVARLAASARPDRVDRLVLVVPAGIVNGLHWRGLSRMAIPMLRYRVRPSERNLRRLLDPLLTTWDEDWAGYMRDSMSDMKIDPRIPPLATDRELRDLKVPTLVVGADEDMSFPGGEMVRRVQAFVPTVETELLENCKHCPPTTPEFRSWLSARVAAFVA